MSTIKCFSVGNGDTYYINHGSDSFTIIDCNLNEYNKKRIVDELINASSAKGIKRFISTHPDSDHITGLSYLESRMGIENFYCVANKATKRDETEDFKKYCELRDSTEKSFYLYTGCSRKWLNDSDEIRGGAGLNIIYPNIFNEHYQKNLKLAEQGTAFNNISAVIQYEQQNGVKALWMGDLEFAYMELIKDDINLTEVDILFAPHHGRDSGKVPTDMLNILKPKIIVIGEAPSQHLNYYSGYNTITQNTAGDIVFDCNGSTVEIYVSNSNYTVNFLRNKNYPFTYDKTYDYAHGGYYLGTLDV